MLPFSSYSFMRFLSATAPVVEPKKEQTDPPINPLESIAIQEEDIEKLSLLKSPKYKPSIVPGNTHLFALETSDCFSDKTKLEGYQFMGVIKRFASCLKACCDLSKHKQLNDNLKDAEEIATKFNEII